MSKIIDNQKLWEEIFSSRQWGKYPSEELIRFIAKNFYHIQDRSQIEILELGVGGGANIWFLAREGFNVKGIEWSESGCHQCKDYLKKEGLEKNLSLLLCGDYFDMLDQIPDNSLDAWFDSASLTCNNFSKTKSIIQKAINKLKIGGKFFSLTPAEGIFGFEKEIDYHLCIPTQGWYANTGTVRYTTKQDIQKLYQGENYKTNIIYQTEVKDGQTILNRLFAIEGERYQ